ncbi:MAG: DUF3846 domain-containing protein [Waltera sp.]
MKVYGYTKDKQGIMEIENSLKAEQAFVGGLIECTALTEEIDLICNEEGWLIGLEPRVAIPESETIIAGDCFICRHDRRGNFQSIRRKISPHRIKSTVHH